MSDLSRRDFLRVSAAGLAIISAGGLILPRKTLADPERQLWPGRIGQYIVCPDDYNPDRQYCALLKREVVNGVTNETIVAWGTDYDPFDGSPFKYFPINPSISFVGRVIHGTVVLTGPPANLFSQQAANAKDVTVSEAPEVFRERPPAPEFITRDGNVIKLSVASTWSPKLRKAGMSSDLPLPIAVVYCRIKQIDFSKDKKQWIPVETRTDGSPKEDNKEILRGSEHVSKVFNNQDVKINIPHGTADPLHFVTEILYDYGESMNESRYRAARSDILEVYVRETVARPPRRHPDPNKPDMGT